MCVHNAIEYLGHNMLNETFELQRIEYAARVRNRSYNEMNSSSYEELISNMIKNEQYSYLRFGENAGIIYDTTLFRLFRNLTATVGQSSYWRVQFTTDAINDTLKIYVSANIQSWIELAKLFVLDAQVRLKMIEGELEGNLPKLAKALDRFIRVVFEDWPLMSKVIGDILSPLEKYMDNNDDDDDDFKHMFGRIADIQELVTNCPNLLRHNFLVVTDIATADELREHTSLCFAQEDTRYVDYSGAEVKDLIIGYDILKKDVLRKEQWAVLDTLKSTQVAGLHGYQYWRTTATNIVPLHVARKMLTLSTRTSLYVSGYLDISEYGKQFNKGYSKFIDVQVDSDNPMLKYIVQEFARHLGYYTFNWKKIID